MRCVVIESPYAGDIERNKAYLVTCIRDCIHRNESPYASHLMLTEALDDNNPEERALGIGTGLIWYDHADYVVFYTDYGMSPGMVAAEKHAQSKGIECVYRKILSCASQPSLHS